MPCDLKHTHIKSGSTATVDFIKMTIYFPTFFISIKKTRKGIKCHWCEKAEDPLGIVISLEFPKFSLPNGAFLF